MALTRQQRTNVNQALAHLKTIPAEKFNGLYFMASSPDEPGCLLHSMYHAGNLPQPLKEAFDKAVRESCGDTHHAFVRVESVLIETYGEAVANFLFRGDAVFKDDFIARLSTVIKNWS